MTQRGRPRENEDSYRERRAKRDGVTQIVAENLEGLLAGAPDGVATLVSDFRKGKTMSPTVALLGRAADALNVPVTAFFVPPDKRDALMDILRTLDKDEPLRDQALLLAQEMLAAAQQPGEPRTAEAEADKDAEPTA